MTIHAVFRRLAVSQSGSSGLGLATTKKLLQDGCKVVVCDINRTNEIDKLGTDVVFSETDVSMRLKFHNYLRSHQKTLDWDFSKDYNEFLRQTSRLKGI
ncbi:hypothetical protein TcWFU_008241 [Taenia crassiceps]|uniref:Uncharacterized protein n=1 Tax=Taenia crassiceps TaxID=6207 RepID=A0ABR4QSE5_9CEST